MSFACDLFEYATAFGIVSEKINERFIIQPSFPQNQHQLNKVVDLNWEKIEKLQSFRSLDGSNDGVERNGIGNELNWRVNYRQRQNLTFNETLPPPLGPSLRLVPIIKSINQPNSIQPQITTTMTTNNHSIILI